jgi:hypothetical protein
MQAKEIKQQNLRASCCFKNTENRTVCASSSANKARCRSFAELARSSSSCFFKSEISDSNAEEEVDDDDDDDEVDEFDEVFEVVVELKRKL